MKTEITAERAALAMQRLINSHFENDNRARCSIPADPKNDDDLIASAYVTQASERIGLLESETARLRELYESALMRLSDANCKRSMLIDENSELRSRIAMMRAR